MEVSDYFVILMFITFVGLLIIGFQVAYCLLGSAILFVLVGYLADFYLGTDTGLGFNFMGLVVKRIYGIMSNWVLVAAPMFIFMGLMLERSGMAERLLKSSQELFGRVRGSLTLTTTVIGVLLAASTGIVGASVVLLGTLSLPTMLKQGYSKELAVGTIAGAGTLGILIPPSIMLVIMADQLTLSVGDLFMGAVFPGLILGGLYILYILLFCYIRPEAAPRPSDWRPISLRLALNLAKDIISPIILIVAVLGSIFAGIATVTEASGIGALAATLLVFFSRKLTFKVLKEVMIAAFNIIAYIFAIIVGATCFALVLRGLGGDEVIGGLFTALPLGPSGVVFFLLFSVFLLGFFLDWIEITLIILPLIAPVVSQVGLVVEGYGVVENPELLWFALLIAMVLQTSFLTPPMGPALFYLQGICPPEVNLGHLYRGIIPFIILQLIALVIILLWPSLVTWLPAVAYG